MITQSKIDNASQIKRYDSLILQKLSLVCSQIVKVYIFNTTHSKKNAENNQSRLTYWLCSRLLLKNSFGVRFFLCVCVCNYNKVVPPYQYGIFKSKPGIRDPKQRICIYSSFIQNIIVILNGPCLPMLQSRVVQYCVCVFFSLRNVELALNSSMRAWQITLTRRIPQLP